MKLALTDLDPQLYRYEVRGGQEVLPAAATLAEAQGVMFACPTCFQKNGGLVGTHMVLVWFADRGVSDAAKPAARWKVSGASCADLTLSPSINVDNEHWHGWVRNGEVT